MLQPGVWCLYHNDVPSESSSDEGFFPFTTGYTVSYFVLKYFFMIFYLVRNESFYLSTIFNNISFFSFCQSALLLLKTLGGFLACLNSFVQTSLSVYPLVLSLPLCCGFYWDLSPFGFHDPRRTRKLLPVTTVLIRTPMTVYLILLMMIFVCVQTVTNSLLVTVVISVGPSYSVSIKMESPQQQPITSHVEA